MNLYLPTQGEGKEAFTHWTAFRTCTLWLLTDVKRLQLRMAAQYMVADLLDWEIHTGKFKWIELHAYEEELAHKILNNLWISVITLTSRLFWRRTDKSYIVRKSDTRERMDKLRKMRIQTLLLREVYKFNIHCWEVEKETNGIKAIQAFFSIVSIYRRKTNQ